MASASWASRVRDARLTMHTVNWYSHIHWAAHVTVLENLPDADADLPICFSGALEGQVATVRAGGCDFFPKEQRDIHVYFFSTLAKQTKLYHRPPIL